MFNQRSKLKIGDTIGVFSPSSPATATAFTRYARGKSFLESKGFKVLEGTLTGQQDYYRSGSIVERANELNELIRNPEVKCIMSAIGGMNSNALLPYIDYDALLQNPKIVIGYSDVTALLLGIYAQTGLTTYYGPALVASFGEMQPFVDDTYAYFSKMLIEETDFPYTLPKPTQWTEEFIPWEEQTGPKKGQSNEWVTINSGTAKGRLMGGNLNTMLGIWGSPYMPVIKEGDILFLEDSLKDAATVERSFNHLKLNGIFHKIGGLILGKYELFNDQGSGRMPHDILNEVIGQVDFPILSEVDCGHTHPMWTLPIGCQATLDATSQNIILD